MPAENTEAAQGVFDENPQIGEERDDQQQQVHWKPEGISEIIELTKKSNLSADELAEKLDLTPQLIRLMRHCTKDIDLMPFGFLRPKYRLTEYSDLEEVNNDTMVTIQKFPSYEEQLNQLKKQFGIHVSYPKWRAIVKRHPFYSSSNVRKRKGGSLKAISKLLA